MKQQFWILLVIGVILFIIFSPSCKSCESVKEGYRPPIYLSSREEKICSYYPKANGTIGQSVLSGFPFYKAY